MCGIAGYAGHNPPTESFLKAVGEVISHRGPNGSGVYRHAIDSSGVGFIHRRLAIIDLDSSANQPVRIGSNIFIFNGEIFNYLEIRSELKILGYEFKTNSDAEVLASAITEWGTDCLDKLEGMWSFAWYNEVTRQLVLCRDRFGEKPLYLYKAAHAVLFASESKAIFKMLGNTLPLNINHIKRYLVNGYKSLYKSGDTFFEGLEELAPGTFLLINEHLDCSVHKYWTPDLLTRNGKMNFSEAVDRTRNHIVRSLELRLRSDVPIAFCLSGGIDSNSIISTATRLLGYDAHGFTVQTNNKQYDEKDLVEASVRQLGIRHTAVNVDSTDFLKNLRSLIKLHDAPIYTISYYIHWLLMRSISCEKFKVVISGTGADELFSGYYDHHLAYLSELQKYNSKLYSQSVQAWEKKIKPNVRNRFLGRPDYFSSRENARDHIFLDSHLFSEMLCEPFMEPFREETYSLDLLRNRMLNELFHESVPVILHEDDHNAMSFSMENRSPFLDRKLFEFCQSIPTELLMRDGFSKAILRESMRGVVCDKILDNPIKVGFNASISDFLDINDRNNLDEIYSDSPIYEIVDREKIITLLSTKNLTNSRSKFLFNFLCAKIFIEEFS
jgi:asparagine synthase (glutamine-hydrolysing)